MRYKYKCVCLPIKKIYKIYKIKNVTAGHDTPHKFGSSKTFFYFTCRAPPEVNVCDNQLS